MGKYSNVTPVEWDTEKWNSMYEYIMQKNWQGMPLRRIDTFANTDSYEKRGN